MRACWGLRPMPPGLEPARVRLRQPPGCLREPTVAGYGPAGDFDPRHREWNRPQAALRSADLAPTLRLMHRAPHGAPLRPWLREAEPPPRCLHKLTVAGSTPGSFQIEKPPRAGAFQSGAADRTRTGDTWNHKKGIEASGASRGAGSRRCPWGHPTHTPQGFRHQPSGCVAE